MKKRNVLMKLLLVFMVATSYCMPLVFAANWDNDAVVWLVPSSAQLTVTDNFNVTVYVNPGGVQCAMFNILQLTYNETSLYMANTTGYWFRGVWNGDYDEATPDNDTGKYTNIGSALLSSYPTTNLSGVVLNFTAQLVGTLYMNISSLPDVREPDNDKFTVTWNNLTFVIHPRPPSVDLSVASKGLDYINLSWTQALPTGASKFILYNTSSGLVLYNGTNTYYNHTSLSNGTTYGYSLYTYNATHALYSLTYQTHSEKTSEEDIETTPTGYTYGNWSHSEHVVDEETDEDWSYADDSWSVENYSWWYGESMIETDLSLTSDPYNTFAILDDSGMDRSQSVGYIHFNNSGEEPPFVYPYVIFSYNNSEDYYCVMYAEMPYPGVWIVHYNGTGMYYLDGEECIDPVIDGGDYDLVEYDWQTESYWWYPDGMWYKLIYNANSGYLNFKWWDNMYLMNEPVGWAAEAYNESLVIDDTRSYGLGVWNPYELEHKIQFDLINLWQVNRTVNASATMEMDGETFDRPHMDFPVFDFGLYYDLYYSFMDETGNLSMDGIRDIMKEFTGYQNMEAITASCDQYDNIYYYSMLIDNVTGGEELMYDEYLYLHIDMCPQGDLMSYEQVIIAIDVDDDGTWDLNDRLFITSYDDFTGETTETQYNGNNWVEANYYGSIWVSDVDGVANLHRYNPHIHAQVIIPLSELVKSTGYPLNASDIFGLSISNTFDECGMFVTWQDWFEGDAYEYPMYRQSEDMFYHFYGEYEPDPSLTEFGEGMIRGEFEGSGEVQARMAVDVSFNDSVVLEYEDYAVVNISVNVSNRQVTELENIVVNLTWWNCSCSDLDMTLVDTDLDLDYVTWYNDSCYFTIEADSIEGSDVWSFYYIVNITACDGVNSTTEVFNGTGTADGLLEDVGINNETGVPFRWGIIPQLNIQYGVQGSEAITSMTWTVFALLGVVVLALVAVALLTGVQGFGGDKGGL